MYVYYYTGIILFLELSKRFETDSKRTFCALLVPSLHTYIKSNLLMCSTFISHWYIQFNKQLLDNLRAILLRCNMSLPRSLSKKFMSLCFYVQLALCSTAIAVSCMQSPLATPDFHCLPSPIFFLLFSVSYCNFLHCCVFLWYSCLFGERNCKSPFIKPF